MLKVISRVSVAVAFLFVLFPHITGAQSAKTIFAEVSGEVLDLSGTPIAKATVHIDGPVHMMSPVDSSGHFVFVNVPPGRYTIRADATGFEELARRDVSIENEDVNLDIRLSATTALKEIGHVSTTTGRGALNVAAAPSYNLTPNDMAFQGETQWRNILNEAPGVSVSSYKNGSLSTIPGSPLNDSVVSIRGALSYETAMLIDNMPMYASDPCVGGGAGVNLSPYDPDAFNAFDVIAGPGAQSPSIVDTIGGSVNLHPAGQVTQNHYDFALNDDPYGGWMAHGRIAMHLGRLSVTATYGFNNSLGPVQTPQLLGPDFGSAINTIDGTSFACTGSCPATALYPPNASAYGNNGVTTGLIGCCYPNPYSGWTEHSGALSLFYQLSPAAIAQFFFADNNHPASLFSNMLDTVFTPPANYTGSLPAGGTTQEIQSLSTGAIWNESAQIYEGKLIFQLGRGQLQLAALSNVSYDAFNYLRSTAPLTLQLYGGGTYCTPGNPSVTFNGGTHVVTFLPYQFSEDFTVHNRDLSANYAIPLSGHSRATVSYVHSYYDTPSTENYAVSLNFGGTVYTFTGATLPQSNFQATDQVRLGYGIDPNDRTSVDLSYYFAGARYHVVNPNDLTQATYSDQFFHYAAPRLSFVWRPNSNWAVRASTGGGFALAQIADLVGSNGAIDCTSGTYCTQSLPNVDLQPETSWGYDVGFDTRFAHSTILSFDLYRTALQGQVYQDTAQAGTYTGLPLFTTKYRNLGQTRYQGLEIDLRRDVPKGVVWSVAGSLMRGYIVSVPAGFYDTAACTNCTNQLVVPGVNFNGLFTNANVPYAQGFAMYGYRWSPDRFVNIDAHYFGKNNGYYAPAFVAFDANVQVPLTKTVALQGTFRNITGILDNTILNGSQGIFLPTAYGSMAYDNTVPYGPRTFLLTLRIHS